MACFFGGMLLSPFQAANLHMVKLAFGADQSAIMQCHAAMAMGMHRIAQPQVGSIGAKAPLPRYTSPKFARNRSKSRHGEKMFRVSKPWKLAGWGWGFLVHLGNRLAGLEGAVSMTQNLTVHRQRDTAGAPL